MAFLGQEEQVRELQDRFRFVYTAVFIGMALLTIRLLYLQILKGDEMRRFSEENRIKRVKIAAPRGMIFDRNRTLLIDNRPAFDLEITPQYLKDSGQTEEVVQKLATLIHMTPDEIKEKLQKAQNQPLYLPVKIKTDLTREEVAEVETWKIMMPGISVEMEIQRTNIFGDIASHLLGYIGKVSPNELPQLIAQNKDYKQGDSLGKFGIEQQLEDTLRGLDGQELVEVDALGRRIRTAKQGHVLAQNSRIPAVPGRNLILTIDQDLQTAAYKAFQDRVGGLVAINPKNGEILAMISYPSFDPTEFSRGISPEIWNELLSNQNHPLRDKTIQDHYQPGSVFKVVTAIAALEEGVIDKNTKFTCPGYYRIGNRVYHCAKKQGHGELNIVSAITQSCNVFFLKAAQKFKSVDQIAKWAFRLGLGKKTGIPLAREVPGLIPTEQWKQTQMGKAWTAGETSTVAIGQSFVLTTGIQLANLYAAIANGGTLFKPYFVKAVESSDGQLIKEFKPQVVSKFQIKPENLALIKQGLWGVINSPHGTATAQRIPGVDFVGKTGTAQVMRFAADKIYQKCKNLPFRQRHHGFFVGFAPLDDPTIAVAVISEHSCSGSGGAAPVARAVIKTYLAKYFPDLYSDKAIAERLKNGGNPLPKVFHSQDDDEASDLSIDTQIDGSAE